MGCLSSLVDAQIIPNLVNNHGNMDCEFLPVCADLCGAVTEISLCRNYPNAECRMSVDCTGCFAKFYDANGREVDCNAPQHVASAPRPSRLVPAPTHCHMPACVDPCSPYYGSSCA